MSKKTLITLEIPRVLEGLMSRIRVKEQILEQKMLLASHHSGDYQGFRCFVLGIRDRDKYVSYYITASKEKVCP